MVRRAGLCIGAVKVSEIEGPVRLEAEYYQPHYLDNTRAITSLGLPIKRLGELCRRITDGSHITPEYQESGVRFLMVRNVGEQHIGFDDVKFISSTMDTFLRQCKPVAGDILLTKVGTIGVSAIVPPDAPDFNIFVSLAVIKGVSPELRAYVSTFLNSRFGRFQAERAAKGISQPDLHLEDIREFLIPIPPYSFADNITSKLDRRASLYRESEHLYAKAQALLTAELGLDRLDLSEGLYSVRRASEARQARRIDAEHFRPKYYRVLDALKALRPKAMLPLGGLVNTLTNGHTPLHHSLDVGEVPFLTAEHVFDFRINFDSDKRILTEHHQTELARTQLHEGDVLITIKGRVGNAAVVEHLATPTNINQDVALLRLKPGYHPYYIAGFLNCVAGKALTEQICTGQINPFLGLGNLSQVFIPIFEESRMNELGQELQEKVGQAYQARQDAQRLLAEAKAEVERLIAG